MLELELERKTRTYQDWLGGTTRGVAAASKLLGRPRSCNTMKAAKALQESILAKTENRKIYQRSINILEVG